VRGFMRSTSGRQAKQAVSHPSKYYPLQYYIHTKKSKEER